MHFIFSHHLFIEVLVNEISIEAKTLKSSRRQNQGDTEIYLAMENVTPKLESTHEQ